MKVFYQYLTILSLDVVLGTCSMAYMFVRVLAVALPSSIYFSLAVGVWLVYTLDHLIDAREVGKKAVMPRHHFHVKYFKKVGLIWGLVLFFSLPVIFFLLPLETLRWGTLILGIAGIHLVLVKLIGDRLSLMVQKELSVAVVYTLGVAIGPVSLAQSFPLEFFFLLLQVFLFGMTNLLELSFFEHETDQQQGQTSVARSLGKGKVKTAIFCLLITQLILVFLGSMLFNQLLWIELILLLGTAVFALIILRQAYFGVNERYRWLGDLCFSLPWLLLLVP